MKPFPTAVAFLLLSWPVLAQVRPSDPGIPEFERYSYAERVGKEARTLEQTVARKAGEGSAYIEVASNSRDQDAVFLLDPATLLALRSDVTSRSDGAVIRRTTEIVRQSMRLSPDEFLVSDFSAMAVTLRAFPWGRVNYARLAFLGSDRSSFSLEFRVVGKETYRSGGRAWDCWKAEMGMGGVLGGLFGKSVFWYASSPPHQLVAFRGASGGPGSPERLLELVSYSTSR